MSWTLRLRRVFNIDIETCGGEVRVIASIEDPAVIGLILKHLDGKQAQSTLALLPPERGLVTWNPGGSLAIRWPALRVSGYSRLFVSSDRPCCL